MKTINRDKIQRMVGQVAGSGGSGGYSSGGDSIITPSWLDENYVAIPYWENLFEAVGTKTTTVGSGTPTTVDYTFDANEKPETKTTTEGGVTTTVTTAVTGVKIKPHYLTGLLGINKTLYFDQVGTSYNVGIGVASPDAKFHVNGNSKLWGNITMHGAISGLTNIDGLLYLENARVGIGVSYPSSKLHVSGNVTANNFIAGTDNGSYIKIGPIRIEYEQSTNSLKVYNTTANTVANLYATGGISSLGIGSGGSGSATALADLSDVSLNNPSAGQILVYRNSHWVNENMPSPGGGGTVTSVGMSVPTGLLVSNSGSQTITSAGTFALTLATGYEMFKPLDYFDASKNAKKANALNVSAAKKVWGQTYLNASGVPQDVTGPMTFQRSQMALSDNYSDVWNDGTNDHPWYGYDHRYHNTGVYSTTISDYFGMMLRTSNATIALTNSSKVGINTTTPAQTLDVNGTLNVSDATTLLSTLSVASGITLTTTKRITFGTGSNAPYIEVDSNGYFHLSAGLYSDSFVSALGQGSGGSGSSGTLHNLDDVDIDDNTLNSGQILVYRNTHWVNEDMPSPGGGGTVTSVGMSVPTGLLVSNSGSQTITASGTFALSLASGYEIPLTADVNKGVTAYGWGDHASAGYLTSSDLTGYATQTWVGQQGYLTGINASMINTALGFSLLGTPGETYDLDDIGTLKGYFTNGVANEAACLTTTNKQAWGQTFWTIGGVPQDVNGNLDYVGNITMDQLTYPTIYLGEDPYCYIKKTSVSGSTYGGAIAIRVGGSGEQFNFRDDMFYSALEIRTSVGVYSAGYVTAASDINLKDKIGTPTLTTEDIASASPILFKWKDRKDQDVHVGAIAQEWQKILPEVVRENDGVLSMDYGVAALVSAMTIAKTVVNHEQRLTILENELNKQKEL